MWRTFSPYKIRGGYFSSCASTRTKHPPLLFVSCRDLTYYVSKNIGFSSLKNKCRIIYAKQLMIARPLVAWLVQELMAIICLCLYFCFYCFFSKKGIFGVFAHTKRWFRSRTMGFYTLNLQKVLRSSENRRTFASSKG